MMLAVDCFGARAASWRCLRAAFASGAPIFQTWLRVMTPAPSRRGDAHAAPVRHDEGRLRRWHGAAAAGLARAGAGRRSVSKGGNNNPYGYVLPPCRSNAPVRASLNVVSHAGKMPGRRGLRPGKTRASRGTPACVMGGLRRLFRVSTRRAEVIRGAVRLHSAAASDHRGTARQVRPPDRSAPSRYRTVRDPTVLPWR